jgi:hypothetical protein
MSKVALNNITLIKAISKRYFQVWCPNWKRINRNIYWTGKIAINVQKTAGD